jgi:hypothetical protein
LQRIRKEIIDLNAKINSEALYKEAKELESLCYNDFDQFCETVLNQQNSYCHKPIMVDFDIKKFYKFFYNSEPKNRWEIILFFINRYELNMSSNLKEEVLFLTPLKQKVNQEARGLSKKNITSFVYLEFENILETAITRLHKL